MEYKLLTWHVGPTCDLFRPSHSLVYIHNCTYCYYNLCCTSYQHTLTVTKVCTSVWESKQANLYYADDCMHDTFTMWMVPLTSRLQSPLTSVCTTGARTCTNRWVETVIAMLWLATTKVFVYIHVYWLIVQWRVAMSISVHPSMQRPGASVQGLRDYKRTRYSSASSSSSSSSSTTANTLLPRLISGVELDSTVVQASVCVSRIQVYVCVLYLCMCACVWGTWIHMVKKVNIDDCMCVCVCVCVCMCLCVCVCMVYSWDSSRALASFLNRYPAAVSILCCWQLTDVSIPGVATCMASWDTPIMLGRSALYWLYHVYLPFTV